MFITITNFLTLFILGDQNAVLGEMIQQICITILFDCDEI